MKVWVIKNPDGEVVSANMDERYAYEDAYSVLSVSIGWPIRKPYLVENGFTCEQITLCPADMVCVPKDDLESQLNRAEARACERELLYELLNSGVDE